MSIQDRVFEAATGLRQKGIIPTERRVRALIGGSPRDICPALKLWREREEAWWRERRQVEPDPLPAPSALPGQGSADMVPRAELLAAVALERERSEAERRHLMMETDRVRQELAAPLRRRIEALEGEILLLKAQKAALERERR